MWYNSLRSGEDVGKVLEMQRENIYRLTLGALTVAGVFFAFGLWVGLLVILTGDSDEVVHESTCRYWNVLTPATELGDTFWIGGWVKECAGLLSPVITFNDYESPEEVVLRAENYIAQLETELTVLRERATMEDIAPQ